MGNYLERTMASLLTYCEMRGQGSQACFSLASEFGLPLTALTCLVTEALPPNTLSPPFPSSLRVYFFLFRGSWELHLPPGSSSV
jgi:hypothetical protein